MTVCIKWGRRLARHLLGASTAADQQLVIILFATSAACAEIAAAADADQHGRLGYPS